MVNDPESERETQWLAAYYHFPALYSCRIPTTSISSALAMPAPGPATVRQALIKTSLELYDLDKTKEELFPLIRQAEILIKPPEKVAISTQLLRQFKADIARTTRKPFITQSIGYREFAHAQGVLTVFVKIPADYNAYFKEILGSVAYWGQSSSLTCCVEVETLLTEPPRGECGLFLASMQKSLPTRSFFTCFVTEFASPSLSWETLVSDELEDSEVNKRSRANQDPLKLGIFIWPMLLVGQDHNYKLLERHKLF